MASHKKQRIQEPSNLTSIVVCETYIFEGSGGDGRGRLGEGGGGGSGVLPTGRYEYIHNDSAPFTG